MSKISISENGKMAWDEKGRLLFILKDNKIAYGRFPDMSDEAKEFILHMLSDPDSKKKAENYLNYKSEENEFCS